MILILVYNDYTVYTPSWTLAGLTAPSTSTLLGFMGALGGTATITLPHSRGDVESYLHANVDTEGFCDIRPLQ